METEGEGLEWNMYVWYGWVVNACQNAINTSQFDYWDTIWFVMLKINAEK